MKPNLMKSPEDRKSYTKPQIVDAGPVNQVTKDKENGTKGEPFDLTLVWGN